MPDQGLSLREREQLLAASRRQDERELAYARSMVDQWLKVVERLERNLEICHRN